MMSPYRDYVEAGAWLGCAVDLAELLQESYQCRLQRLFEYRNHGTESPRDRAMIGTQRQPELLGQTVVVIGGSSGIGLETARRARVEGASVILTGRNPARLKQAALELGALSTSA